MNDTYAIDKLGLKIKGEHIFEILDKDFFLFHEIGRVIFGLPPSSYIFCSELEVISREILVASFPTNFVFQRISMFASKWNIPESPSTITSNSQDNRIWGSSHEEIGEDKYLNEDYTKQYHV